MQIIVATLLLARIFAQAEPQQIAAPQAPDSLPVEGQYSDDSVPTEALEVQDSMPVQRQDADSIPAQEQQGPMPVQSPPFQDPNPGEPYPVLKDLLSSVGVDNIGPDQPGGYGSGLSGQTSPDGAEMRSGGDTVDHVVDQQKQQLQQQQAEKAANQNEGAPSPQQGQPQAPGQTLSDPTNGMVNNPINPAMPGMGPQLGQLPNANNAFGIPSIPQIADFTLPPTPPPHNEIAKSKDEAKDSSPGLPLTSSTSSDDDASRTVQGLIIGFSVGGAVLFGCAAGVGLMWMRHKRQEPASRVSSPV